MKIAFADTIDSLNSSNSSQETGLVQTNASADTSLTVPNISNESIFIYINTSMIVQDFPVNTSFGATPLPLAPYEPISTIFIIAGVLCVVSVIIVMCIYKRVQHTNDVKEWIKYSSGELIEEEGMHLIQNTDKFIFDGIKLYV